MNTNDDQRVIEQVLAGDVDSFADLIERYQKPIYNLMFRATGSAEEAAELTQEAFVRTYENLPRFHRGRKFFPWLYTISLNVARDYGRRTNRSINRHTDKALEQLSNCRFHGEQQQNVCDSIDYLRLEEALGTLPLLYREALVLRYHEELAVREIAEALSISISAAKMRISRGLEMLRGCLKEVADAKEKKVSGQTTI
ncbi:MAG: RNA polymerase sigma factor [Deltaproteobacteria bacterium]|nr:RNA polymerase sigma factor [Deltaproteobacteria bacterium]MBW2072077.1 RNA polymerase sigma factor [Deltaproteobacteria bacterium]